MPIATLTATLTNLNIDLKKHSSAKPQDYFYFPATISSIPISSNAANCFFSLINDSQLPGWTLNLVPLDDLRKTKDINQKVPKFRALLGEGVMVFAPLIRDDILYSSFVVWENAQPQVQLTDVDDNLFNITIETDIESNFEGYSTDVALRILASGRS